MENVANLNWSERTSGDFLKNNITKYPLSPTDVSHAHVVMIIVMLLCY